MIALKRKQPEPTGGGQVFLLGSDGRSRPAPDREAVHRELATMNVGFGRYKALSFQELAEEEPEYCSWILAQNGSSNMRMNKLQAFLRNLSKLKEQRSEALKESQAPVRSAVTTAPASHPVSAPSSAPARALMNEDSVRAEAVRTTARPLAQSATVASVSKLLSMGFEEEDALRALAEVGTLEAAVNFLLTEPPKIPQSEAEEAEVTEVPPSPQRPRAPPAPAAPKAPAPARVVRSPGLRAPVKATIYCDDSSDSDVQIAFD